MGLYSSWSHFHHFCTCNVEDLTRFATMYHLEEMMYHENCPRSVQLQPKDKFRMVLFQHEHKDPTASKYFKMVQENFGAPPTPNSQQKEDGELGMTMTPLFTMKTSLYDIVFRVGFAFELKTRLGERAFNLWDGNPISIV